MNTPIIGIEGIGVQVKRLGFSVKIYGNNTYLLDKHSFVIYLILFAMFMHSCSIIGKLKLYMVPDFYSVMFGYCQNKK